MNDLYQKARQMAMLYLQIQNFASPADEQIQQAVSFAVSGCLPLKLDEKRVAQLYEDLKATMLITTEEFRIIHDEQTYASWLPEARGGIQWKFWGRYKMQLLKDMGEDSVGHLDRMTDAVLNNLFNPLVSGQNDRRGMVVGHVQSGKTGNFTGLICKAADAGFRFIIVLTGMTSDLRNQTQNRIDFSFLGRKTRADSQGGDVYFGVGADPKYRGQGYKCLNLTSSGFDGDFNRAFVDNYRADYDGSVPIIAIVKKNKAVLANLIRWLTGLGSAHKMPALIIDDEADNASVNTKYILEKTDSAASTGALETQPESTAINSAIRALLMLFRQRAYVGYTATPFANIYIPVLNSMTAGNGSMTIKNFKGVAGLGGESAPDYAFPLGQDLFPRDFIVNLSAPTNYVGPHRIFGMTEQDETSILPVFIPVEDYEMLIPDGHKNADKPPKTLPPSLEKAIKCFILTCAIRRLRGQEKKHNSMLIHVSRFNEWQKTIAGVVSVRLKQYQEQIQHNVPEILDDLRKIWIKEYQTVTAELHSDTGIYHDPLVQIHTWEQIKEQLNAAASRIEVRIVNGLATHGSDPMMEPLDFDEADRQGRVLSVIAVGGDKLARGFTLAGLSISYYLRATRMYDTLMQMARWFGYRPGYVDLCRLFTTPMLKGWYRHVTLAMEEMRSQFDLISALPGRTPQDYGIRVRTLPGELQITAANKRRTGHSMDLSYSGTVVETYNFRLEPAEIRHNMEAGRRLIEGMTAAPTALRTGQPWGWRNVPAASVLKFLNEYTAHQANLIRSLLTAYIEAQQKDGNLTTWTVVLVTADRTGAGVVPFSINGKEVDVRTLLRTADESAKMDYQLRNARILSPGHEALDLTDKAYKETLDLTIARQKSDAKSVATRPSGIYVRIKRPPSQALLLLYPLDPVGTAIGEQPPRATEPVLGYAISFPVIANDEKVSYVVNDQFFHNPELGEGLNEEDESDTETESGK